MSELMNTNCNNCRRDLLATVSVLVLIASVHVNQAKAEDSDRPTLWIELGGQLEQISGGPGKFAPHFLTTTPRPDFENFEPLDLQNPSRNAFGEEGKVSFSPEGSDWIISAAVRYGRSHSSSHKTAHSNQPTCHKQVFGTITACQSAIINTIEAIDARGLTNEAHLILDFQAGRDVGLGMFGHGSKSTFDFGVRYAQLGSSSTAFANDLPDLYFPSPFSVFTQHKSHHHYVLSASAQRSFHGIGPSISWDASAPIAGHRGDREITFDWGLMGSLLFGRQKAKTHHRTSNSFYCTAVASTQCPTGLTHSTQNILQKYSHATHTGDSNRSHSVIVPNFGGFAGLSFRYSSAKVSLGYRADFFFNAMDGGIDARKNETIGFHGPYATISVGIGG